MQVMTNKLAELTADAEIRRKGHSENLQRLSATVTMLDHNKNYARKNNACGTCARTFADETELGAFLHKQVSAEC